MPGSPSGQRAFGPGDLDLLIAVLSAHDTLFAAAHAAKLIEAALKYPIRSIDSLADAMDRHSGRGHRVRVGRCDVSVEQARQYLPADRFPIGDREQLISCLIHAFEVEHHEVTERAVQAQARASSASKGPET